MTEANFHTNAAMLIVMAAEIRLVAGYCAGFALRGSAPPHYAERHGRT